MIAQKQYLIVSILLLLPLWGFTQPNFSRVVEYQGIRCFMDIKKADVAYYAPGTLSIKTDRDGKPDFNLLETRYTGNVTYADRGKVRFLSFLRFRVKMEQIPSDKLLRIKKELWPNGKGRLHTIPVTNIKTMLVFTPVTEHQENSKPEVFTNGNLTPEKEDGLNKKGNYWKEREFTLRVDNRSAQLLSKAFELGQPLISLSYAFFSEGVSEPNESVITEGENKVLNDIEKNIEKQQDSTSVQQICIRSNTFSITIDAKKWPDMVKQIDINEEVPPGYAALEVRCYDFNNNLRPDLFAKKIEIRADGVGHGEVIVKKSFSSKAPDIYSYNIRFPYAVRLDKPLYYRVTSISDNSPPVKTEWIQQSSWIGMIDITSSDDQIIDDE